MNQTQCQNCGQAFTPSPSEAERGIYLCFRCSVLQIPGAQLKEPSPQGERESEKSQPSDPKTL
jgi:hypothetical protein